MAAMVEKNHQSSPGIWLVYYKKIYGKARLNYDEAVEEALCFGCIDSLPRKPKSVWSQLNKKRVAKLIKSKQIKPAGLTAILLAK
jgi:uncharacterized protein YdeI (YjbR/CyaY-like superfamily)